MARKYYAQRMDDHTKTVTIGRAAMLQLGHQCNCWQAKYQLFGAPI